MATTVIMPRFGMTQEQSTIVAWLVEEGSYVQKGDPICEVTTDKINMEVEAPADGYLKGIRYRAGDVVPVTEVIAYIVAEGEEVPAAGPAPAPSAALEASAQAEAVPPTAAQTPAVTPVARRLAEAEGLDLAEIVGTGVGGKIVREDVERALAARSRTIDGKVRATPAARRLAREHGIDLTTLVGSGPQGRVQGSDVQAALTASKPAPPPAPVPSSAPLVGEEGILRTIPLEGMRATIARRMQASYQQAPHITFTVDVDMTNALALRADATARLPEGHPGVSLTAVIIKVCAWALRQHPLLNSHLVDDKIVVYRDVHIGMAVALDGGLIVPVIHHADRKGLIEIAAEVADLAQRSRENRLRADDITGGTFTVSNLGMFGIDHFTAILNPPEVGILAVGSLTKRFVPDEHDQPVLRPMLTLTLSADHRAVDGAAAARFLATLREALEQPARTLL